MDVTRRKLLARGALGALAFQVTGGIAMLTPRAAHAAGVPLRALTADEVATVEALGETLLPGATQAGIAQYLDQQLAAERASSLLMIRYLDVPPPYMAFYRPCLAAAEAAARRLHGKPLSALDATQRGEFVGALQRGALQGWQGPPAPFFYFVLRSDVVDVVYGTPEGFEKLGVPYMPHIMPAEKW